MKNRLGTTSEYYEGRKASELGAGRTENPYLFASRDCGRGAIDRAEWDAGWFDSWKEAFDKMNELEEGGFEDGR